MKRVLAVECLDHVRKEKEVLLKGWVKTRRDHGKLIFIDLRDRTGVIQVVFNPHVSQDAYQLASELRSEYVIRVIGVIRERPKNLVNPKIATGTVEIEATDLEVLSKAETLPFDMGMETLNLELPTLLDYRSLTLRHPRVSAIFRVQEAIVESFREIAKKLGCVEIFSPTIVASSTEGGAEVFRIDYYDHSAFLAQSPQLYKQMLVPVFERLLTIAHAYRAEPSVTTRHLSESLQMDCEFGFVDFNELLDLLEEVGMYTLAETEKKAKKELGAFGVKNIAFGKIPRLTLAQAQEVIAKETGRNVKGEKDLSAQDEVDMSAWALKTHKSDFVTITHFPTKAKPFYTMPDPKDPTYSLSYDLLFRGLEIMSGSQRINDYNQLVGSIKGRGMDPAQFELYLQAFKYGMPPEGGFSFGLERMTMKLLGLANIREASLFPRDMERADIRLSAYEEKKASTKKGGNRR